MIGESERNLAERLIWAGNFTLGHQVVLMHKLNDIPNDDEERFFDLIEYLNENQVDPISAGRPYSQRDILTKMKNEL